MIVNTSEFLSLKEVSQHVRKEKRRVRKFLEESDDVQAFRLGEYNLIIPASSLPLIEAHFNQE